MTTTTSNFTKEQLIAKAREQVEFCRHTKITGEGRTHVNQCSALFEIALAALTAEPVAWLWTTQLGERDVSLLSPYCDENAADALASGWGYRPLVLSADNHQPHRPESDTNLPPAFTCSECGFETNDPEGRHYCCEDNSDD